jgi:hypothetical protein
MQMKYFIFLVLFKGFLFLKGVWSTPKVNEIRLNKAFRVSFLLIHIKSYYTHLPNKQKFVYINLPSQDIS